MFERALVGFALVAAVGIVLTVWRLQSGEAADASSVATASRGDISVSVGGVGRIVEARASGQIAVPASSAGSQGSASPEASAGSSAGGTSSAPVDAVFPRSRRAALEVSGRPRQARGRGRASGPARRRWVGGGRRPPGAERAGDCTARAAPEAHERPPQRPSADVRGARGRRNGRALGAEEGGATARSFDPRGRERRSVGSETGRGRPRGAARRNTGGARRCDRHGADERPSRPAAARRRFSPCRALPTSPRPSSICGERRRIWPTCCAPTRLRPRKRSQRRGRRSSRRA